MAGVAKWLRPRFVVPVLVGSSPIIRPIKREVHFWTSLFILLNWDENRKAKPCSGSSASELRPDSRGRVSPLLERRYWRASKTVPSSAPFKIRPLYGVFFIALQWFSGFDLLGFLSKLLA